MLATLLSSLSVYLNVDSPDRGRIYACLRVALRLDDCVITVMTDSYIHCSLFVVTSVSTILWRIKVYIYMFPQLPDCGCAYANHCITSDISAY
jgi:hypothetical protein